MGDIFLEPEVMEVKDLFIFPPLFLTGFVFFSAFLGRLVLALGANGSALKALADRVSDVRPTGGLLDRLGVTRRGIRD